MPNVGHLPRTSETIGVWTVKRVSLGYVWSRSGRLAIVSLRWLTARNRSAIPLNRNPARFPNAGKFAIYTQQPCVRALVTVEQE